MKSPRPFFTIVAVALSVPVLLGACVAVAYHAHWIGASGFWVDALNFTSKVLLDKATLVFEVAGLIYVAAWTFFGGLHFFYRVSKGFLIKCFVGLAVIPVFAAVAAIAVPELRPVLPIGLPLAVAGVLWGWLWYEVLP